LLSDEARKELPGIENVETVEDLEKRLGAQLSSLRGKLKATVRRSTKTIQFGGPGGGPFDDEDEVGVVDGVPLIDGISKLVFYWNGVDGQKGPWLNAITVEYRLRNKATTGAKEPGNVRAHGAFIKGERQEAVLGTDEKIVAMMMDIGKAADVICVTGLTFVTVRGGDLATMKKYGRFGCEMPAFPMGVPNKRVAIFSPNIWAFHGQTGWLINKLGFHCEDPTIVSEAN